MKQKGFSAVFGTGVGDTVPDEKTIWDFKNKLTEAKVIEKIFNGYKDHVKTDKKSKMITKYRVTDTAVHDSRELVSLITKTYRKDEGGGMSFFRYTGKTIGENYAKQFFIFNLFDYRYNTNTKTI